MLLCIMLLTACGQSSAGSDLSMDDKNAYNQISMEEAVKIMEDETGYLIVDVRRPDEFSEGHIPGAINVPNEEITDEMPEALPDKDQMILIYCRSGNRSKQASEKLAKIGYTNIYEFGGIIDWTGYIVTEEMENMTKVTYDLQMKIGDTPVEVEWEDNASVDSLAELVAGDWHEISLSMYGGFEQVGSIGQELPSDDKQTTTGSGDIVLYSGDQIVVFYGSNSWAYTRLGHITDKSDSEMEELLGNGDVTISLKAEYSE